MSGSAEGWKTVRWIAVLAALVAVAWLAVRMIDLGMGGTVSGLEKVLGAITRTDTRIVEGRAQVLHQAEISELALIEMKLSATRSYESESYVLKYLPAGTKRLIIRGEYRVTAGYRLVPGVSLTMENGVPVARFPEPEILSVELLDYEPMGEKEGWANSITPEDRSMLLRELREQMKQEARRNGMLEIVESTLQTRMKDLLDVRDVKIERLEKPAPGAKR